MRLRDFTYYPDVVCRVAFMRPYEWGGNEVQPVHRSLLQRLWFYFVSVNIVHQMLGMAVYVWLTEPQEDFAIYLEELSESLSMFGFGVIGTCNLWTIVHHRNAIEYLLTELELLFPKPGKHSKYYQTSQYYERSTRQMRHFTEFFKIAIVVFNLEPIAKLVYELSFESQQFQYKYQSNVWYPWQLFAAPDSIVSYAGSYLCQMTSSLAGVIYIMAGMFWLCFFITQMELHFDGLAERLLNLDASQPRANDDLKELISYHERLLQITSKINHIFNNIFLLNFSAATIGICMIAFSTIMVKQLIPALKFFQGFLAYLVVLYFICSSGSKFSVATDKVMPAAVYNNWYKGDASYRRMILFLIMQSCKSRALRVYNYTPVSMETYMDILKLSYKMLTFFQSVIE